MAINRFGDEDEFWQTDEVSDAGGAGAGRLDLDDGDEQLPWLESDDDYESDQVDTGRIAAFAIIGFVIIGLIVGGIWWLTRDKRDPALLADGSTIEAPEEPYKTKPEDPGGKTFQGTGDTAFAVAEGQSREGQLAENIVSEDGEPEVVPPSSNSVGVQVGAYTTRSSAEQGWSQLVRQYSVLSGLGHRVVEGQADIGTVYRLQALAADLQSANTLCADLKSAGGACQVKR